MYDFEKILYENEKIIYSGISHPEKGDKSLKGILILAGGSLLVQFLLIWSVITKTGDGANGITISFIIIYGTFFALLILAIVSFINNFFLRKKLLDGNCYCITNRRAIKYEKRKNKLTFGYLVNYPYIECCQIKDNYGDLRFQIDIENVESPEITDDISAMSVSKNVLVHPNHENMPYLMFECIEEPDKVRKIAIQARNESLENIKRIEEENNINKEMENV